LNFLSNTHMKLTIDSIVARATRIYFSSNPCVETHG
jgi:hypothetical protein